MKKDISNFIKGQRPTKAFNATQEARGFNRTADNVHSLRMNGVKATPSISLTGSEYRALNTTESSIGSQKAGYAVDKGVFQFIDHVIEDRIAEIAYVSGLEAVQSPAEGATWNDNADADADSETNATVVSVLKGSAAPKRYHWESYASEEFLLRNIGVEEMLMAEMQSHMNRAIAVDALAALGTAATATGDAFAAEDVVGEFLKFGADYRFVGANDEVIAVKKALLDCGAAELAQYANVGAAAGFGWVNGKVALWMPSMQLLRDQFSKAVEGEIRFNAQANAELLAVDVVKFAAS